MLRVNTHRRAPAPRWITAVGLLTVALTVAGACSYRPDLELPDGQAISSKILAADGSLLTVVHGEQNREPVVLDEVATPLRDSVIAIEDARYFDHDGVDPRGVLRALARDAEAGRIEQGGSTITQQYVRAVLLDDEQSLTRKVREAVLAVQLERKYSKREILERYLNTVYFGNGAYGVETAAQLYFGRSAREVNLSQAALLAGLIQNPGRTDPYRNPAAALDRRNVVLDRMAELDLVTAPEADAARSKPIGVVAETTGDRYPAPHFVERVKAKILNDPAFGPNRAARERLLYTGGLVIETALDPARQAEAELAVAQVLVDPANDPEAALASIDPKNGHVVAYVGGRDFFGTQPSAQVDLADAGRSSGSAFKPFVLAAALDAGIPLDHRYAAPAQITIPIEGNEPWTVANYGHKGYGSHIDLTEATVESVNTVYAQLMMDVGPQVAVDAAARLGVTTPLEANPAAVLGTNGVTPLDLASAYSSFAADGLHAEPVFVTRVTSPDGTVLYQAPKARRRVLSRTTSRTVTDVLQEVVTRGTGVNARIGRQVAGKTGTAEEHSDAWFVGYTPDLATAVWIGFPEGAVPMTPPRTRVTVTGGTWPAEIWQRYQGAALADRPALAFPALADAEADERDRAETGTTSTTSGARLPSVIGMREADARRVLASVGADVRTATEPSADFPPGVVLRQAPEAGARGGRGTTVTLTLAVEPIAQSAVPTVLGLGANDARALIETRSLGVEVVEEAEPSPGNLVRAGLVWKQSPGGGTAVDVGTRVRVWVNPG